MVLEVSMGKHGLHQCSPLPLLLAFFVHSQRVQAPAGLQTYRRLSPLFLAMALAAAHILSSSGPPPTASSSYTAITYPLPFPPQGLRKHAYKSEKASPRSSLFELADPLASLFGQ